jgi:hypothetical protein
VGHGDYKKKGREIKRVSGSIQFVGGEKLCLFTNMNAADAVR